MALRKLLTLPLRYKPWRPRHAALIARDIVSLSRQLERGHGDHANAALDWLCHAQDQRDGQIDAGSVSAGWSFEDGWLPGYPETSGYIVETFLAAAEILKRPGLRERAGRIIDWELSLQQDDGAFPGHFGEAGSHPVIFNTGQIMHGMVAAYTQLGRDECLAAAVKAGYWLKAQQDPDGCWRRFEHNGVPHVYNTRATWALVSTALLAGDEVLQDAAVKNLDWALSQQTASGWFRTNAFTPDASPFTHTIAYAIRGFLESGVLLDESRYLDAALKAARGLAAQQRDDGWLAGTYDEGWRPTARYCCLTGVAQMTLNWLRLAQVTGDDSWREPARRGIGYLKRNHDLTSADPIIRGGILGSAPIWGAYSRFEYPNWAAKFFADALLMTMTDSVIPALPKLTEAPQEARAGG
ncbi:MAG TPA: hypothetical protein ENJ19_10120 [Gammaproteobacteria bacterium]|nr:hypothetical protein [Gammaproteobacteria bacterium]